MKNKFIAVAIIVLSAFTYIIESTSTIYANDVYSLVSKEKISISDNITEEIIIEEKQTRSSEKSGRKTTNYYNGSSLLWSVTVYGTFQYGNNTAKCISASVSTTVKDTSWKISGKKAYARNNTAIAEATGKLTKGILIINTINKQVKLTCSSTGSLS